MHRVSLCLPGNADDVIDVEIGGDRGAAAAHLIGLVHLESVQRETVSLGVNGDCSDPQLRGGARDPDRNLTTIGNQ